MKVVCPQSSCRAENEVSAVACTKCGTFLQSYTRLRNHSAHLFNQGLACARKGELEQARDLFAAVVYWSPKDVEARNALAMACLALNDQLGAKRQWELVLAQTPADKLAWHGLNQIAAQASPTGLSQPTSPMTHLGQALKHPTRKKKKKS